MFRNHLKIAFRSLGRHRLHTLLNILGLGLGLAAASLIAFYLYDELTFDTFHDKSDRIYRILDHKTSAQQGEQHLAAVSFNLAPAGVAELPAVEEAVRFTQIGRGVLRNESNQQAFYETFWFADSTFWEVFDFELTSGDPATALDAPDRVVLSADLARRLFGEEDPLGQPLATDRGLTLTVSGVLREIPANSHLQFNALISMPSLRRYDWYANLLTDWHTNFWGSYVLLDRNANPGEVADRLTQMAAANQREEEQGVRHRFELQPLSKVHFQSAELEADWNADKGNLTYLRAFGLVGFFILLIACINYMNLATARNSHYAREVGIRKVAGADRRSLVIRFFTETLLLNLAAFTLAVNVIYLSLPWFNRLTGKQIAIDLASAQSIGILAGILLLSGLIAGSYPALYLSRFRPATILKGDTTASGAGSLRLRRGLVIFQFALSTVLIIGTLVAYQQLGYIQQKDLGFDQDHLVVVDINSGRVRSDFQTIKAEYGQLPAVQSVSVTSRVPGEWKVMPMVEIRQPGQPAELPLETFFFGADEDFLATFEIELADGRNFDPERTIDSAAVLINGQTAARLGFDDPVGREMVIPAMSFDGSREELEEPFRVRIIGVVEDFHFQSLHDPLRPLVIGYRNNPLHSIDYFTVRLKAGQTEAVLGPLAEILQGLDPDHLFEYHFLEGQLANFYEADRHRSRLFNAASVFAVFISCLGLFGLAAFTAERRTKEIGIRKILGASVANLFGLLTREFLWLILGALILAVPLAWLLTDRWLDNFAFRVELRWWMFAGPALLALLITVLTVSYHSVQAAMMNPADCLQDE